MLDSEGFYAARPHSITTWTGLRVDPLNLTPEDISISDIAHALSLQCRYNGHSHGHLSVARHSIWVSECFADSGLALWGLLHDAAETYIGDMVRPLKHSDEMRLFRDAEERIERVIAEALNLPYPMPVEIRDADTRVLKERELPYPDGARYTHDGNAAQDEADFLDRYLSLHGLKKPTKRGIVIGLTGVARSGKDTVGSFLVEKKDFVRLSFAGKLYGMLLATDPLVPRTLGAAHRSWASHERLSQLIERVGWEKAKDTVPEVRQLLQRLGTEGGREHLGQNVWIDAAIADVRAGGRYVFTDVRFSNEAEAIRKLGGEIWRVERPGFEPVNSHASDAGIPAELVTRTIRNDGTKADLRRAALATFTD